MTIANDDVGKRRQSQLVQKNDRLFYDVHKRLDQCFYTLVQVWETLD